MSSSTRLGHGLPTNPRSGSRLARTVSSANHQSEEPRPSRTMSAHRSRNPPSQREPVLDTHQMAYRSHQHDDHYETNNVRRSADSNSTFSSGSSSYWTRGNSSQRSSRTTVRSDEGMEYSEPGRETHPNDLNDDQEINTAASYFKDTDFGWSRMTEVANVLTQEVSKVWATGIYPLGNGEDDEEGESHLTRVMRAYHLSKARTPAELPDWLFSERERGQGGLLRFDKSDSPNDRRQARTDPAQQAQRRNRPAYQGDNTTSLGIQSQSIQSQSTKPSAVAQAKISGSDRLKQMRDLRRNASSNRF